MATATKTKNRPWQEQIADQLGEIPAADFPNDFTHAVMHHQGDTATLLDTCPDANAATIAAEDHATKVESGEVTVVTRADLEAWMDAPPATGTATGEDAEKGKLFDVPRVAIIVDDSDPTVLKLSFSGSIELDRSIKEQAEIFNRLAAGNVAHLRIVSYVKSGPTNVHRRDSEGNVDAIVASKSLVITDIRLD